MAVRLALAIATLQLATAVPARAQAWLPRKGEGSVSILFQNAFVVDHLFERSRQDVGHITSNSVLIDATYGLNDHVTITVSLPYIASKYDGARPHQLPIDDGSYHPTFQDLQFNVRYSLARKGIVITPFLGTVVPSHYYEYFAHSAVGLRLTELQVGTYVARVLDPILPGVFVSGRYAYGFREHVLDTPINRSLAEVEVGYFVRPSVRVFGLAAGQLTHGGVELPFGVPQAGLTPEQWIHHDQIARNDMLNVGGAAAVSLTDSLELSGSLATTVTGRNGHALHHALALGVTWSFQRVGDSQTITQRKERALVKCLCEKTAK